MALPCDAHLGLLCIPILLALLPFARTQEEVCCSGAHSVEQPPGELQGWDQLGRAGVSFCCVACNLSYCCSSAEARLNQQLCSAVQAVTADGRGEGFTPRPTAKPAVSNLGWFGWFFIAIITVSGLTVCMCCCYNCYNWVWAWLLSRDDLERPVEWEGVAPPGVTSLYVSLPDYVSMDPPAYSAEDPEDAPEDVPLTPVSTAPAVQIQHLYSRDPEDQVVANSSAVSVPSLVHSLEMESSV